LANKVVEVLDDLKAESIKILSVEGKTPMCDYFVIATVLSPPQAKAIVDELLEMAKPMKLSIRKVEGSQTSRWILLDFGDVIIHLFYRDERMYYDLEGLWKNFSSLPQ